MTYVPSVQVSSSPPYYTPSQSGSSGRLWVPALLWYANSGTPTHAVTTGATSFWLMDAAALEQIATPVMLPDGWVTYDADFYWSNHAASAGDVKWGFRTSPVLADGAQVDQTNAVADLVASAPGTAGILEISTIAANQSAPAAGSVLPLAVRRTAADAADTLANDARFYGVMLRKVT